MHHSVYGLEISKSAYQIFTQLKYSRDLNLRPFSGMLCRTAVQSFKLFRYYAEFTAIIFEIKAISIKNWPLKSLDTCFFSLREGRKKLIIKRVRVDQASEFEIDDIKYWIS